MKKDALEKATEKLSSIFEETQNTIQLVEQSQLLKYIRDDNWIVKQYKSRDKFRIKLIDISNKELEKINQQYEETMREGLKNTKEKPSEEFEQRLKSIKEQNRFMMLQLTNQVYKAHQRFINKFSNWQSGSMEVGKLEKTNQLYEQITKVLNSKEAQDEYKIVYRDGKKFSFKSYMEMNARTTLNQEISKQQLDASANNGDVFWLCNNFEDCRTSHIAYQGKVYFDERYQSFGFDVVTIQKIEKAIADRGMLSRQQVENSNPFLGNCPNCRHEFVSVPIEDVISMSDRELLKDNNMNVDKATEDKYRITQQQRLYERKICDYKYKVEQSKNMLENAPKGTDTTTIQNKLNKDQSYLNAYYKRIRQLVKENDYLERDYQRESVKIIREDLGYRHNKR